MANLELKSVRSPLLVDALSFDGHAAALLPAPPLSPILHHWLLAPPPSRSLPTKSIRNRRYVVHFRISWLLTSRPAALQTLSEKLKLQ